MKVAIYIRISTEQQELEQQIYACKKFCEFKGFNYEIFKDIGSGKDFKRKFECWAIDKLGNGYLVEINLIENKAKYLGKKRIFY